MAPHHLCLSPRHSRSRSRSQLVFLVVRKHSEEQGQQRQHSKEAPEAPPAAVPHRMLGGGGGHGREIEMRSRSRGEEQSAAILEVIRGMHTLRAVASTIGTSLRRRASNAVPARAARLASALTNSDCSYCESGRCSCNQRSSWAIRGHHGHSEVIMGNQCQSGSVRGNQGRLMCNHKAIRGNQRQSEAIRGNMMSSEAIRGNLMSSEAIRSHRCAFGGYQEAIRGNQEAI